MARPRKYSDNAEKQKAYRQRVKQPKALRNPLELQLEEIQAAINAHHSPGFWADPAWIDQHARLFDQLMAARRALRAAKSGA